ELFPSKVKPSIRITSSLAIAAVSGLMSISTPPRLTIVLRFAPIIVMPLVTERVPLHDQLPALQAMVEFRAATFTAAWSVARSQLIVPAGGGGVGVGVGVGAGVGLGDGAGVGVGVGGGGVGAGDGLGTGSEIAPLNTPPIIIHVSLG